MGQDLTKVYILPSTPAFSFSTLFASLSLVPPKTGLIICSVPTSTPHSLLLSIQPVAQTKGLDGWTNHVDGADDVVAPPKILLQ